MIPFTLQPDTAGKPGGSALLDRILAKLSNTLESLRNAVTNDAIVSVTLTTAETRVFHGLSTPPRTVEVVGINAPEVVYETTTNNPNRDRFLFMAASGPVTVRLRVTA